MPIKRIQDILYATIDCQKVEPEYKQIPSIFEYEMVSSNTNGKKESPTQQLLTMLKQMKSFYHHFTFEEPTIRPVFFLSYFIHKLNTFHKIVAKTSYLIAPDKFVPDNLRKAEEKYEDMIKTSVTLQETYHFNKLPALWEEQNASKSSIPKYHLSHTTEDAVENVMIFFDEFFLNFFKHPSYDDFVTLFSEIELEVEFIINTLQMHEIAYIINASEMHTSEDSDGGG